MEKRPRLDSAESNEDTPLKPSQSSLKRHPHAQEQDSPKTHQSRLSTSKTNWVLNWIPQPSGSCDDSISKGIDDIDVRQDEDFMSTGSRKRTRAGSDAAWSVGSECARTTAYAATDHPSKLEKHGCFMQESKAGPNPDDVAFYQRLLRQETQQVPTGTAFENPTGFRNMLHNRSKTFLLHTLHPLLMPCAEILCLLGRKELQHVTDGLDESWFMTVPIHGPKPQPDHSRCLKPSAFDKEQLVKLDAIPGAGRYSYAVRPDMYFPYLTCEILDDMKGIELADRQNMHSMSIALRSLVQLAETAGTPEKVHRRILGYSISHDRNRVDIHGYYPELRNKTEYYRCLVAQFGIWFEDKWKCYNFVNNLDAEFLPKHIALVKEMLAKVDLPRQNQIPQVGFVGYKSGDHSMSGSEQRDSPIAESYPLRVQSLLDRMENKIKWQLTDMANTFREEERERDERRQRELESLRQLILNKNQNN